MKVLIDECLPTELRLHFPGHRCVTVQYLNAKGSNDNNLLETAVAGQFDVVSTIDGNLRYQQNFKRYPKLSEIFLSAPTNNMEDLSPLVPAIQLALSSIKPGQRITIP